MEFNFLVVIGLLAIGVLAGSISGLIGIGGGIIMVPIMVLLLGMTQHQAQGTSLAVMVPPIGILAAMHYYKQGHIDLRFAAVIAVGFLIGGFIGGKFAVDLPEAVLRKSFAAVLLVVAVKMFFTK
jgi:uncharacterized protein